jgi:hypothetical protein
LGIILVGSSNLSSLFGSEILNALISLEVILDVVNFTLFINPLISVRAVTIYMSVAVGSATVRE